MRIIRSAHAQADTSTGPGVLDVDPLQVHAEHLFSDALAASHISSVRAIRAHFHLGQPRAQWIRDYV